MRFVFINDKICAFNLYKISAFVDFFVDGLCRNDRLFEDCHLFSNTQIRLRCKRDFLHADGLFGFLFECGAICFDNSFLKKLACFGVDGVNDVLIFSVGSLS